ncbi:6-phosphogluconolactonase/glucosamine-6-phosphate isomerase/deaminase [Candidatus Scalindua japonica]|uniref:6-phosphogluconolactonase/glucosamine-6-phosphate isomerase/deaminase n=1 Tax=Candidatus Scalindua japonica TaxID=1284222 RepID=A0A286U0D5_9BACT|nr:alginate export family protein [Candidatus Scalindua japonica]GAX61531.1 6-phosphogluconolactonase/glucosamine-6-phosphate isomerase/deaminase [Candidatus Scalindua japonica]
MRILNLSGLSGIEYDKKNNLNQFLIIIMMGLVSMLSAEADDKHPSYNLFRYNEDWSELAHKEQLKSTDFFDPVKYIPLNQSGSNWLSFGFEERVRVEKWSDFQFDPSGTKDNQDAFVLNRIRTNVDLHLGPNLRLFAELKSAIEGFRSLPSNRRRQDRDTIDLQNLFADFTSPLGAVLSGDNRIVLRVGRQEMARGSERFIGSRNFANVRQSFDGINAMLYAGGWRFSAFGLRIVRDLSLGEVKPDSFNNFNLPDSNSGFFGIYGEGFVPSLLSNAIGFGPMGLDLYVLRRDDDQVFNGTGGNSDRYAVGGRLHGKFPMASFGYEIEGAYEFGNIHRQGQDADINASMFTVALNYQPTQRTPLAVGPVDLKMIQIGFDYASGDNNPGGDVQTFDPMFQTRHKFFGFMDFIGRFNIMDLRPRIDFSIGKRTTFRIDQHIFWRSEKQDALYSVSGGVIAPGRTGSNRYVGTETDLTLKHRLNRHTDIETGFSHFYTGDFLDNAALSEDSDWFYLMMTYTF